MWISPRLKPLLFLSNRVRRLVLRYQQADFTLYDTFCGFSTGKYQINHVLYITNVDAHEKVITEGCVIGYLLV